MKSVLSTAVVGALLFQGPVLGHAQGSGGASGGDLLFQSVPTVTGASRYAQDADEAPASISIITREEIRRMGYRTLAEILTSTRGIYASNDRNYTYLGIRGFARAGNYNTRLLVLVDGHRMNEPVSDYVAVGHELPLAMEDIERVEIIRGPGSTLYGTNALLGVVNIVTRRPTGTGAVVSAEGGNLGTWRGLAGWDGRVGGARLLVSAGHRASAGETLRFPDLAGSTATGGVAEGVDAERSSTALAKVLFGPVQVTAGFGTRRKEIPTGSYESVLGAESFTTDRRFFTSARYEHAFPGLARVSLRAAFDSYRYEGTYIYEDGTFGDFQASTWTTLDAQYVHPWGRHRMIVGGEARLLTQLAQGGTSDEFENWEDTRSATVAAAFVQDEVRIGSALLTLGLRYDYYSPVGGSLSPRGALIVPLQARTTLKLLAGRAFRAPNGLEQYYYDDRVNTAAGQLDPEFLTSLELVVEQSIAERARVTGSVYRLAFRDVVTLQTNPDDGSLTYANLGAADGHGVELEVEGRFGPLDLRGSYAYQRVTERGWTGDPPNAPRHLGRLGGSMPLLDPRLTLGMETRTVSRRLGRDGGQVPGYAITSARLVYVPRHSPFELSISGTNLLNRPVADPGGDEHAQLAIPQEARTVRVGIRARF